MSIDHGREPLLQVRNLATGYGDLRVVWDVSFDAHAGQITTLLGRNGSGKTTSLRAVAGLNGVDGGSIIYDGADLSAMKPNRRVGAGVSYVQEGKRIFRRQSVKENLLLGGYSVSSRKSVLTRQLDQVYDLFPMLADRGDEAAGSLSGGQQQMVAIGQALMASPRLLMIDEPSGGLAPSVVLEVMERIAHLKTMDIAVVLVEQAVDAALEVADQVVVLEIGKVIISEQVRDVDREEVKNACLGTA